MPAVEQVEFQEDSVGAIPMLDFGKAWIQPKQWFIGTKNDIEFDGESWPQIDSDQSCLLNQTFVRILIIWMANAELLDDVLTLTHKDQGQGRIPHRRISPLQTGGIELFLPGVA